METQNEFFYITMPTCKAYGCKNSTGKGEKKSFFMIPRPNCKDEKLRCLDGSTTLDVQMWISEDLSLAKIRLCARIISILIVSKRI